MQQELREMDAETLEKYHATISSDKAGETEFMKTLQDQMGQFQVRCLHALTGSDSYMVASGVFLFKLEIKGNAFVTQ